MPPTSQSERSSSPQALHWTIHARDSASMDLAADRGNIALKNR
jgi:hypothetical protein